jgi:hypothetical protein
MSTEIPNLPDEPANPPPAQAFPSRTTKIVTAHRERSKPAFQAKSSAFPPATSVSLIACSRSATEPALCEPGDAMRGMSQRPAVSELLLPGSDSTEPCVDPTQGTPRDDRDGARHHRDCGRDAVLSAGPVRTGRAGDRAEWARRRGAVVLDEITPEHPWRDAVIEAVGAVRAAVE